MMYGLGFIGHELLQPYSKDANKETDEIFAQHYFQNKVPNKEPDASEGDNMMTFNYNDSCTISIGVSVSNSIEYQHTAKEINLDLRSDSSDPIYIEQKLLVKIRNEVECTGDMLRMIQLGLIVTRDINKASAVRCLHTEIKAPDESSVVFKLSNSLQKITKDEIVITKVSEVKLSSKSLFTQGFSRIIILVITLVIAEIAPGPRGCEATVMIKPKNIIVLAGNNATFSCSSDLTDQPIWWYHSGARQQEVKQVSDESSIKEEFRGRYASHVLPSTNPKEKISELIIRNVTLADGGSIYCKDDGDFGTYQLAKLSIVTAIRCSAACVDDHLLVTCSTSYWSEDDLLFMLQNVSDPKPDHGSKTYNSERSCIDYEALWNTKIACHNISQRQLNVILKENSTDVTLEKYTSLNVLVKDPEILVTKSSQVNDRTVSFHIDGAYTDKPQDPENCRPTKNSNGAVAGIVLGIIMIVIISIVIHCVIYRRWLQRKRSQNSCPELMNLRA